LLGTGITQYDNSKNYSEWRNRKQRDCLCYELR